MNPSRDAHDPSVRDYAATSPASLGRGMTYDASLTPPTHVLRTCNAVSRWTMSAA
jgi:hypothetical protein